MKLVVDFSTLWSNIKRMGAHEVHFDLQVSSKDLDLDRDLSSTQGLDITLDDLQLDNGVLSVKGRQVLLFIPDQAEKIEAVLAEGSAGTKFHVADCIALNEMRQRRRFNRYKATYNVGGKFQVYGISKLSRLSLEGEASLKVCKFCLKFLNYKGYESGNASQTKSTIFAQFDIVEFLSTYSTLFKNMPERLRFEDKGGYAEDWKEVSERYRSSVSFCCESCKVDLSKLRTLLHTHHISGNKRENHPANLMALCVDCHRKQPKHDYMRVTHEQMTQLNRLRKEQGLLSTGTWSEVREMADQALDGLLHHYESKGIRVPEVGYELVGTDQSVVAELEIAWPDTKKGIAIGEVDLEQAKRLGWNVISMGQALVSMNK